MNPPHDLDDPEVWSSLVTAANPAALLVSIGIRMGPELKGRLNEEDIWQETLLKAWNARREFRWEDTPTFRRWLLRIADNCIADHRARERAGKRDHRRTGPIPLAGGSGDGSSTGVARFEPWGSTTPSRIAAEKERAIRLREALDALPEEVRDVVRMRLFEEMLLDDIAAELKLGVSAVRRRFRKGAEMYWRRIGGSGAHVSPAHPTNGSAERNPKEMR